MSLHPTTQSREYREGWLGRRRNYHCRECGNKFQVDTLNPLPEKDRLCSYCKVHTTLYIFIDKTTSEEQEVRAFDPELATLKAWKINPNLTIKPLGGKK